MQAFKKAYLSASIGVSTHVKGKPRPKPVWLMRYRLPSGIQSERVLGKAWTKRTRPPEGYLSEGQAIALKEQFLADHSSSRAPSARKSFAKARADFIARCTREKRLRTSTLHGYQRIGQRLGRRLWRAGKTWDDCQLGTFTEQRVLGVYEELLDADRAADTLNHYRRVIRGIFGTAQGSVALVWEWTAPRPDSDKLHVYTPAQVERLRAHAYSDRDLDLYTLATEAGLRQSEQVGLKIINCDLDADGGLIRVEDAFTIRGGAAGTKSHRVRAVPTSANVREVLWRRCHGRPTHDSHGEPMHVFVEDGTENEPISAVNLYRRFISACERAGLPRITYHDLRHTFGTQMIRHPDVDIEMLRQWMGHADVRTTMRYLHYEPRPEHGAKITEVFGRSSDRADVVAMPARRGGRPARYPGRCPHCGAPKAPGQPYCAPRMREVRRASEARRRTS
ncbi:MAG TPA: site-specific integrase [Solirubrobacteraceae bacterium]|jgi:integrase|nr:site-specific integrase [Solirubrobacteraceae bacterium]